MPIHIAQHRAGIGQFDAVRQAKWQQQPKLQPQSSRRTESFAGDLPSLKAAYNQAYPSVSSHPPMPMLSRNSLSRVLVLGLLGSHCSQALAAGGVEMQRQGGALSGPTSNSPVGRALNQIVPIMPAPNTPAVCRMPLNKISGHVAAASADYQPMLNSEQNEVATHSLMTKAANYMQGLGDCLINNGLVSLVAKHPTQAALTIGGGLALVGLGTAMTFWQPRAFPQATNIRDQLASIYASDGQTLDTKIRDAIHQCGGDRQCARDAVSTILKPHGLMFTPPHDQPVAGWLPQAQALDPVNDGINAFADSVDLVVEAYERWDEQSLFSDVEQIARAPDNDARRDVLKSMLEDRGFTVQAQPFKHSLQFAGLEGDVFHGENLLVDVCGEPAVEPDRPVIMLVAHSDAVGEGSKGAIDNASGCAVALALSERLRDNPPEGMAVRLLLVDGEEQGRLGSGAAVKQCQEADNCPYLTINIDLAAYGDHIYASPSNASHFLAMEADDIEAARMPKPEQPSEKIFLEELQSVGQRAGFEVSATSTSFSDHLTYQFAGEPAVGLSLLRNGQVETFERVANLSSVVAEAHAKIDWATLKPLKDDLDGAFASGDSAQKQAAMAAYSAAIKAQPAFGEYVAALKTKQMAVEGSWVTQELHNANDTLAAVRPAAMVKFTDAVERSIRDFAAKLA